MENRNIDELNAFAESLDNNLQELQSNVETYYATKNELLTAKNQIFYKISDDVKAKIQEIYTNVSSNYDAEGIKDSVLSSLSDSIYTKDEIDNKHFLTEHQSLADYLTKESANTTYVKRYELSNYLKCNCLKQDDLDNTLKNYITFQNLYSSLSNYYTKNEIESKLDSLKLEMPVLENTATKSYVKSIQNSINNYIQTNYLSKNEATDKYLSISKHNEYVDYVDNTYMKKSDFEYLDVITYDDLQNYVSKSDISNYALKSTVTSLTDSIRNSIKVSNLLNQRISSLSTELSSSYSKTIDIYKNFYKKSDIDELFLLKTDASSKYLESQTANDKYLSKREARYTYLAIEDYKSLKASLTINDSYNDDADEFFYLLKTGKLIDGIYIVGNNVYIVKNGEAYKGISGETSSLDVYTKTEINNFDFASKTWVTKNCKGHNWIITNEY